MMSLETLLLLRHCLTSQVLQVGAPDFKETADQVVRALVEVDDAIALVGQEAELLQIDSVEQ